MTVELLGITDERILELESILDKDSPTFDDYITKIKSMDTTEDERLVLCAVHGFRLGMNAVPEEKYHYIDVTSPH